MTKILIVSSDYNLMTMIEARLLMDGYEVITAADGFLGFQKVQELNPDLLIVDAGLSKMSGHQLIEKVKGLPDHLHTPLIVLADRAGVRQLFSGAGIFYFCSKPVICTEFMENVTLAVKRSQLEKAARAKKKVLEASSGRGRILLGGPHEFILKKIHGFFVSHGFDVEIVTEDEELVQKAGEMRPDYIFVQLWEDRNVFDVRKIDKLIMGKPELRKFPFYVFCVETYASEARDFIDRDHVIPFRESRDLLVRVGRLLSIDKKGK